jgi:adenosylcobinamide-phosphate synthase
MLELNALIFANALLLALAIDHYLGEPATRWHPVVWMGNYLGWAGRRVQRVARQESQFTHQSDLDLAPDFEAYWLAAFMWMLGAAVFGLAAWQLQNYMLGLPAALGPLAGGVLAALLLGCALKPLLAWAMLKSEVLAVEKALNPEQGGSLAAGRERLSWLVSRDVAQLTETQVRESAIETLAENLNDSVVAPLFWFVLLGLPGAALYRFANTADAMWGYRGVYKGHNWEWAGKWAAWADDLLSWIPARLTAYLLALVFWLQTLIRARAPTIDLLSGAQDAPPSVNCMTRLRQEARRTPSPNSGWPMAAMALALGVSLQKPGVYVLNAAGRAPRATDMPHAIFYAANVVIALVLLGLVALGLMATGGTA